MLFRAGIVAVAGLAPNLLSRSEDIKNFWSLSVGGTGSIAATPTTLNRASQQLLPDSQGGAVGHGFTCVGAVPDPITGHIWVGNYGQPDALTVGVTPAQIVELSADGSTVISAFNLGQQTLQGICNDEADDTLWYVATTQAIINVSKTGTVRGSIATPGGAAPNGLARDTIRDGFWITVGNTLYLINRAGTTLRTFDCANQGGPGDQLWHDVVNDYLWVSSGANGSPGEIWVYDIANDRIKSKMLLDHAMAIEGIFIIGSTLYAFCDGYYHSVGPGATSAPDNVNSMQTYALGALPAYVYNRVFSQYAMGPFGRMADRVILNKGAGTTSSNFASIGRTSDASGAVQKTGSIYMRSRDGVSTYSVGLRLNSLTQIAKTVTGTWQRFSVSGVADNAAILQVVLRGTFSTDDFADILITAGMVQLGPVATTYNPRLGA